MLGVVGSNLTIFKPEPTTPNMSQHIATRWSNARNMLRPTMLRYVALACCDRLAGALYVLYARADDAKIVRGRNVLSLGCFSIVIKCYCQGSFNLTVILSMFKITQNTVTGPL